MKSAIKKLLPQPMMNKARDLRDFVQLSGINKREFDTQNLATDLDLEALLNDQDMHAQWDKDHADILQILDNEDKAGGVNPGDRRAIYMLIAGLKPQNVLEVGTHIGASTLYITRALMAAGGEGHVTSVDIYDVNGADAAWKGIGLSGSPIDNVKALGGEGRAEFMANGAQVYMSSTSKTFDFIFLDGDHAATSVYNELSCALKILKPSGVILLHDYYPNAKPLFPDGNIITGPFRAMKRAISEDKNIVVKSLGALPWETKQGSKMTSLALVLKS
jgi:predicted O-methyltransferase YrrM